MPSLEIDGKRVGYGTGGVDWRAGQPLLVFLHGAGGDHTVWALQARALAQHGWNVAAPDLPGHGQSEDAAGLESVEGMADWVARFLDALGAERAVIVGHSMGACVALTLAAGHGKRVSALALVGAGDAVRVNPELLDDTLNDKARASQFIAAFGHGRGAHFGRGDAPGIWMIGATLALLGRCAPAVLHRDFAACDAWDGGALAGRVACPALVVSGEADRMTPPRVGRALAEAIPDGRYELLADTGHMMMAEMPTRVTKALRRFLDPLRDGTAAIAAK